MNDAKRGRTDWPLINQEESRKIKSLNASQTEKVKDGEKNK
jgi:hypothetical protein